MVKGSPASCQATDVDIRCKSETNEDHRVLSRDVLQGDWAMEAKFKVSEPTSSGILFAVQDNLKYGYFVTLDPHLTLLAN